MRIDQLNGVVNHQVLTQKIASQFLCAHGRCFFRTVLKSYFHNYNKSNKEVLSIISQLSSILSYLSLQLKINSMSLLQELNLQIENKGVSTGANWLPSNGETIQSFSPVDGQLIASITSADKKSYEQVMKTAEEAFKHWRAVPAPQRGEVVRQIGEAMREYKEPLGRLVSYEMGKSLQE